MSIYAPEFAHKHNATQRIANAYAAAGLTPPSFTSKVAEALAALPTADDVAARLGREALAATDATQWIEEALADLARARDTDALRQAVQSQRGNALDASLPGVLTAASDELAPAFAKHAKELVKAAAALLSLIHI